MKDINTTKIEFGVYTCRWCKKEYTVNQPETWNRCTPEYCHECVLHFDNARVQPL